jgi:hypothetical protein
MRRLNSKLESEGAEFLVLGRLLTEKIAAYKTYTNEPDYDLVAVNAKTHRAARIQVKSRWATDAYLGFLISRLGSDFVVHVRLNLGIRYRKRKKGEADKKAPQFFVLPTRVVRKAKNKKGKMGRVMLTDIPNYERYEDD